MGATERTDHRPAPPGDTRGGGAGGDGGASRLTSLRVGQEIPYGGDRIARVDAELAAAFAPGDRLVVVQTTGDLLRIPAAASEVVRHAVGAARAAFGALAECSDDQITAFFRAFAARLGEAGVLAAVRAANAADVDAARQRGRSTTRLSFTDAMHAQMVAGLRIWESAPADRDRLIDTVTHADWAVEVRRAPLGVVGFVFEGRPNVFADAVGVLRSGNTVVFRIGSDALGTAQALMEHAVRPSLHSAGLPAGAVALVESAERAAGWALFSDDRLALAVARGSGAAVAQLGAVARQSGVPVSLHGTGGAWMLVTESADLQRVRAALTHSLDRKVCNTTNVVCVTRDAAPTVLPEVLAAVADAAARLDAPMRLHVTDSARDHVPAALFTAQVEVPRPEGPSVEPVATALAEDHLGTEWEWEQAPEISLCVVDDLGAGVDLCNRWSPQFVVSVISENPEDHALVYRRAEAPFVGDGFTRWVDGQYALLAPELGLSNWEGGRLLGRSAILSGDSVHTLRLRARIANPDLHR